MSNEKSIHQKNILPKHLTKEICKFINELSSPRINDFFSYRETLYNTKDYQSMYSDSKKTVKYGTEIVTYRGPHI